MKILPPSQTKENNIVRQKKRRSAGTLFCTQYPKFSTTSQDDLFYHIAKTHNAPEPVVTLRCEHCYQHFPGFNALRQHKSTQLGCPTNTTNVESDDIHKEVVDMNLKEDFRSCQQFSVDSQPECARGKVFNFAIRNLDATIVAEKLDHIFNNLKCAAKMNLIFGFILKNIEDGKLKYI